MDFPQLVVLLLGGGVIGVIVKTVADQWNRSRETKASERRNEIDRAANAERDVRILKKFLSIHRHLIINADCLGP